MEGEPDYTAMTDADVQAEIDRLTERYWDLQDQIHEAELIRAALRNTLKERRAVYDDH